jgi:hypothetical protein
MIAQAELQPFAADEEGRSAHYNEYHVYTLPWPDGVLSTIAGREDVRMRVTLSYFVDPNPGNRTASRYGYPGCRLKFRVSTPGQPVEDLKAEVNHHAQEEAKAEDREVVKGSLQEWKLGSMVFKGSVHSDFWEGPAAKLMSMKHIAVFPTAGWWKTRPALGRSNAKIRYSLIVSLHALGVKVDLYSEVQAKIQIPIEVPNGL